jgi:hypothetical protein
VLGRYLLWIVVLVPISKNWISTSSDFQTRKTGIGIITRFLYKETKLQTKIKKYMFLKTK